MSISGLAFVNDSKQVTADQVAVMASAIQLQIANDLAPVWNISPVPVAVFPSLSAVPVDAGQFVMHFVDAQDVAGSDGYHNPFFAEVEVNPIIENGGGVLDGGDYTVSSVASHEAMELLGNPDVNLWIARATGPQVPLEIADPVQALGYILNGVRVSDFVTPAWFGIGGGPLDKLGYLTSQFQVAPGGYVLQRTADGTTTTIFGDKPPPDWRKAMAQRRLGVLV